VGSFSVLFERIYKGLNHNAEIVDSAECDGVGRARCRLGKAAHSVENSDTVE